MAEVVKTGLLAGGRLWELVEGWEPGIGEIAAQRRARAALRGRKDARRGGRPGGAGLRAILNLGHSIGHAIESAAGFTGDRRTARRWRSGCCRRCGCRGRSLASTPSLEADVRELLRMHELPTGFAGVDAAAVREALRRDKKSVEGRVRFVLLEQVGKPVWGVDVDDELIDLAIGRALAG